MNKSKLILLTAAFGFAISFTFSCSSDNDGGNGNSPNGNNSNSQLYHCQLLTGGCIQTVTISDCSQAGGSVVDFCQGQSSGSSVVSSSGGVSPQPASSSSVVSSSSSRASSSSLASSSSVQSEIVYGDPVTYEGETYETVVIGTQTWFKRNLNYYVIGSKCYDNDENNCDKYGRLYDWATAMGLDATCNSSICASQIQTEHKGICPQGWHIPSNADWDILNNFVGGAETAGTKLKATSGWGWYSDGNGTDDYGFSALPGGYGGSDGNFSLAGSYGDWWSASESSSDSADDRGMYYFSGDTNWYYGYKSYLFSVRCLQDYAD